MIGRVRIAICLAILALGLSAATAVAEPVLDLHIQRATGHPLPVHHGDEHLAYELTVNNLASQTPVVGDTLSCLSDGNRWGGRPKPTLSYRWLRNGASIGEEGPWPAAPAMPTHTLTAEDAGKAIQCEAIASSEPEDGSGTATVTAGSNLLTDVATAKGSGTLAGGSATVTDLTTSQGSFRVGQTISGEGIAPAAIGSGDLSYAAGSGTVSKGSNVITNVNTLRGAFKVGQEIWQSSNTNGGGLPQTPGTVTITAVGAGTLTISVAAGATSFGDVSSIELAAASKTITNFTTTSGAFAVGRTISGPGIPQGTTVTAVGPNTLTLSDLPTASHTGLDLTSAATITAVAPGTLTLSEAAEASGSAQLSAGAQPFAAPQVISGPGIAPGTTVTKVLAQTLTLSAPASADGEDVAIEGRFDPIAVADISPPTQVEPIPSPAAPSGTFGPGLNATSSEKGGVLTCTAPPGWTPESLTWTFIWLRNAEPAPHAPLETTATQSKYELTEEDVSPPATFQCEALAKDTDGNEVAVVTRRLATLPEVGEQQYGSPFWLDSLTQITFENSTSGPLTVEAEMPAGVQAIQVSSLKDKLEGPATPWSCTKSPASGSQPSVVKCVTEKSLPPGDSYEPILLVGRVTPDAPDALTTKACASGGGADNTACAEDTLSGFLPAIPFGFKAFETSVKDAAGDDFNLAGGHPFEAGAHLAFNEHIKAQFSGEAGYRAGNGPVREVRTEVPPGFVGNPQAVGELCPSTTDVVAVPTTCPAASAVGQITFRTSGGRYVGQPIYAIEPERGTPAQLAFGVGVLKPGFAFTLTPELRPGDNYGITLVASPAPKFPELFEADVTLCGRGAKLEPDVGRGGEATFRRCWKASDPEALEKPFLTLPTKCGDEASSTTRILADTWDEPGKYAEDSFTLDAPEGCDALHFDPSLKARPTTNAADSPTGLEVELSFPQDEDPEGRATAQLNKAVVTLPEGLVVNPSSANGLDACSPGQIKLGTNDPVSCPNASKIGSVEVSTPILGHPLPGSLYIASPHDNPFGSLLALYLVIDSPDDGLLIKLPGKVEANPSTGQLTTTFDQNPQAPVESVKLKVRGGAAAPLRTPVKCAKYTVTSSLTPWSAPESGPSATPKDSWSISKGPEGKGCASNPPNEPNFEAGTTSAIAGTYSPFVVKLSRKDGSQSFSALNVTPPPGLLGKLAGIPYCPDSSVAAASSKSGKQEQASPSCPVASKVGTVVAGAGAGPKPYYATSNAYLSGPYKGAPVSLVVITPAVAGPFDLGNVITRVALKVDPETAKIDAVSDPLPQILEGIPLDVRSVAIAMDRPDFTLNPTSCDPMAVTGSLTTSLGESAALSSPFQVGECGRLGFKPKLSLSLKGKPNRGAHPAFKAVLTMPPGGSNIASTQVVLPRSEFIENAHFQTICTRVQYAADQCPKGSVYGHVKAISPLVDYPLEGPVYLRSSSHELPDLVMALRGPASQPLEVDAVARIDSYKGGLRSTFEATPDAPLTKLVLSMAGAKKGLFVNSRNVCKTTNRATASFVAHNGKEVVLRPKLQAQCGGTKKQKHQRRR